MLTLLESKIWPKKKKKKQKKEGLESVTEKILAR